MTSRSEREGWAAEVTARTNAALGTGSREAVIREALRMVTEAEALLPQGAGSEPYARCGFLLACVIKLVTSPLPDRP